jgi:hypothetical protein
LPAREASKMLLSEPAGSFLLRTNEEEEYRITFKKVNKVEHMRIYFRDSVYYTGGYEDKPYSSLRRLVDHLIEDRKVFSIPIISTIHERRTSTSAVKSVRSTQVRDDDQLPQGAQSLEVEEENSDFDSRIAHSLRKICNSVDNTAQGSPDAGPSSKNRWQQLSKDSTQNISTDEDEIILEEVENVYENTNEDYENEDYENDENDDYEEKYPCLGMMSSVEAQTFLQKKPNGSWILRINESGEKRIAVKKPRKVMHIKLFEDEGLFSLSLGELMKPLDDLLQNMEEQGTLGIQITER